MTHIATHDNTVTGVPIDLFCHAIAEQAARLLVNGNGIWHTDQIDLLEPDESRREDVRDIARSILDGDRQYQHFVPVLECQTVAKLAQWVHLHEDAGAHSALSQLLMHWHGRRASHHTARVVTSLLAGLAAAKVTKDEVRALIPLHFLHEAVDAK